MARYGYHHQRLRQALAPQVATGTVDCWRCGQRIRPDQAWDLGHSDNDVTKYQGPEHANCNRSTAASRGNRMRVKPKHRTSRDWLGG